MSVLNMSLAASWLILFIALSRCIFKNLIPKIILNILWAIVCCKLILPPSIFRCLEESFKEIQTKLPGKDIDFIQVPVGIYQKSGAARQLNAQLIQVIWLIGVVCLVSYFIWSYIRCIRMFRFSLPADANEGVIRTFQDKLKFRSVKIRVSDQIVSPLTYGVLHPVILMPKNMDWNNSKALCYILEHEMAHIRRWDSLYKICLAAVLVCHWFNPLVWMMYYLANRDIELACDQKVIQIFGTSQRADYANLLVDWGAQTQDINLLASHLLETFMKERIVNIMKTRKIGIAGIIMSMSLVIGAASVYAATPVQPNIMMEKTIAEDLTLGGIFELYTVEEYEEVIENVKKNSSITKQDLRAMESDLAKLKKDNGKGKFVIYKSAFNVSTEVNGSMITTSFNPTIVMAPELVKRDTPITAESYQKDIKSVAATLDQAISEGTLTQGQKKVILNKMYENLSKLK